MKPEIIYNWYAPIYSFFNQFVYKRAILARVAKMELKPGQTVLSVACGTGDGFVEIMKAIGPDGVLVGIDASAGMLKQAQKLVDKNGWKNVHLIKCDAANPPINKIKSYLRAKDTFDVVTSQLGLSVVPQWKKALQHMCDLVDSQGKLVIMDWHTSPHNLIKPIVDFIARSNTSRPICSKIRKYRSNYVCDHSHLFGNVFVGSG